MECSIPFCEAKEHLRMMVSCSAYLHKATSIIKIVLDHYLEKNVEERKRKQRDGKLTARTTIAHHKMTHREKFLNNRAINC